MALICYIHGAGASPVSFTWLREHLPHPARFFTYDVGEPAISCIERMHKMLRSLPDDEDEVVLVGHSLGGIIAAAVAARSSNVGKLVTMCAPFGGLPHANIVSLFNNAPIFRDLQVYSSLLMEIRAHRLDIPHLAIVAENSLPHLNEINDGVVTLASQMALERKIYRKFSLNHFEVLLSPDVAKLINEFLMTHHV